MENKFTIKDMNLYYGSFHALKGVNLNLPANEVTAFIGPSGCGKSTLLRSLNRMNDLVEGCKITGDIRLDNEDIYGSMDINLLRKRVGMVFQKANPFPMSIYDNIAYGPRTHGIRSKSKLNEIVEKSLRDAAIWDEVKDRLNKSALGMSGGQQQRLCIARALAVQPEVLLMDEPTSALDPISTSKIEDLVIELKKEYTVIIVTHNMQQATRVSDKTAFFLLGEVMKRKNCSPIQTISEQKTTLQGGSVKMRELYTQQLMTMKTRLIQMGAMCEDAISCSVKGMLNGDAELLKKVESTEMDINQMEREIERLCMRLLLMQQPVASDLRSVSSALKIISDLERIGDQAYDIAEIAKHLKYSEFAGKVHIQDMAAAAVHMVTDSVEAFVKQDLELAQNVLKEDDTVDQLFNKVRADLIHMIRVQEEDVEMVLDLLMIAKYLERIGDHAENVAEWVVYLLTGEHV